MAMLVEKFRACGGGVGAPVGIVVVGLQGGYIDVPVASVGVDRGDLIGVPGQDPFGGLVHVEFCRDRAALESDSVRGKFVTDRGRVVGAQPDLVGVVVGHDL